MANAIAAAAAHPLGVGDAFDRHANKAAYVDTVPFGAFRREILALVGFFDENLLANEDYDFNTRIRRSGGKIWLDPFIRSIYIARPTLAKLARQYSRYGYGNGACCVVILKRCAGARSLPPLFVASLLGGAILAVFLPVFRFSWLQKFLFT